MSEPLAKRPLWPVPQNAPKPYDRNWLPSARIQRAPLTPTPPQLESDEILGLSEDNAEDCDAESMAERAGKIPAASTNNRLTTAGQRDETGGQKLSNDGQRLGLDAGANVEDRTGNGQTESNAGQDFAPKWPQKDSARLLPDSKRELLSELQEVVDVWEELSQPLKEGILAIVRGVSKQPERE